MFAEGLLGDVAAHLAPKLQLSESTLRQALCGWQRDGGNGHLAEGVARIDCTLLKQAPNSITLCVRVLHEAGAGSQITSFEIHRSWDELPRELRSEFIRSGQKELHYLLCGSPPKTPQTNGQFT